jgi:pseudouridine synthase
VYFAYHKPKGLIVDRNDPQHRPNIFKQLSQLPVRVESVDKLDIQSTGLLLLTNDGDLAHKLTSNSSKAPRKFLVKIWKRPDERRLQILKKGVFLDDGKTRPLKFRIVEETDNQNIWMEVLVTESRHRLLKRIFDKIGHPISKIKRISFATISIGKLEPGEVRMLTGEEVRRLKEVANGIDPRNAGNKTKYKKGYARPKPSKNAGKKRAKRRDIHRPNTPHNKGKR